MSKPIVAIVGRPNVGKSTLFNKISGSRISIVEDTPGVTRDRIYNDIEWNGRALTLVDTGGIEPRVDDMMLGYMREQAQTAIETADVIVFMVDVTTGVTASDRDVATMLMKSRKPLILCVNKVDSVGELPMEYYEFYELGIDGDPIPVSSVHGTGTGDLLDRIVELCPDTEAEEEDDSIKVAVIGKPNAGKSSIINKILGENRLIVSNIAGTTRDAIDTAFENEFGRYTFIDTAGIRRQSKVNDRIEKFSVLRSKAAVERADVCLILIDGTEGLTEQDERIAGLAHEAGKPSVIVVNKWDAVEKDNGTVKAFEDKIRTGLAYMSYAPIMFVSAKTGQRVDKLFETIHFVDVQNGTRVPTGALNEMLARATAKVQPPSDKGKRLKVFYITQISTRPPTFVCFVNQKALFHFSYQRYLENQIRETFGLTGTPIKMITREHGDGAVKAGKV